MTKEKKFNIFVISLFTICIGSMIYFIAMREISFQSEGQKTMAKILDKKIQTTKKKRGESHSYFLEITYSADPKKILPKEAAPEKKNKTIDEIINGIGSDYSELDVSSMPVTTSISVFYDEYISFTAGSKIEIYYLASDPSKARLAKYVEY